jgi:diacylglycerol kinase (ATP)
MKTIALTEPVSLPQQISTAVLISNPEAGRKHRLRHRQIQAARRELEESGISVAPWETIKAGDGERLARNAIQSGAQLVVVCGGDGTINEVVCGMAQSQVPLAVLPGGTANVLARELGLPLDIPSAARLISKSTPRRVALGRAGSRYFLLMAGIGFDARVVRAVNGRWKKLLGMSTYVIEAFRQLFLGPPCSFVLSANGIDHKATFACISRSQHYGPIRLVREADLFSSQFYTYCFPSERPARYLLYALAVLAGRPGRLSDFRGFAATTIQCEQVSPNGHGVFLQVDGEPAGRLPCTIEIVPDALTLLVPTGP